MDQIYIIFRLLAFSQALLLGLIVGLYYPTRLGRITAITALGFACYLIIPVVDELGFLSLEYMLALVATAVPSIIWMLGYWYFTEESDVPPWIILLTVFYVSLAMFNFSLLQLEIDESLQQFIFDFVPQFIKLGLIAHLVYMALQGHATDLVASRQRLRRPLAVIAASAAAIVILVEIWARGDTPLAVENLGAVLMFVLMLAVNVYLLRLGSDFLVVNKVSEPAVSEGENAEEHAEVLEQLQRIVGEERFYAHHGATIADLAGRLSLPEYRLRRFINGQLGYRNFNQFLNHYRIEEAAGRLVSEPGLPILTIALDVGFSSLSSFNKAFRERLAVTPTEFRLTNSSKPD